MPVAFPAHGALGRGCVGSDLVSATAALEVAGKAGQVVEFARVHRRPLG